MPKGWLLFAFLPAGLIWAVLGAFGNLNRTRTRVVWRAALVVGLFAGMYTFDDFYCWRLRTNRG